jgi:hypothetical protein
MPIVPPDLSSSKSAEKWRWSTRQRIALSYPSIILEELLALPNCKNAMVNIEASDSESLSLGENDGFKENETQSTPSELIFKFKWVVLDNGNPH